MFFSVYYIYVYRKASRNAKWILFSDYRTCHISVWGGEGSSTPLLWSELGCIENVEEIDTRASPIGLLSVFVNIFFYINSPDF